MAKLVDALILDIDGVLIGEKVGYNSPYPHEDVISKLRDLHSTGVPVVLCTGRPNYAIRNIIDRAKLTNPHITDGGAVIIDPISNEIVAKHIMPKNLARSILETLVEAGVYVEVYTIDDYYIQKSMVSDITTRHNHILQRPPKVVKSLVESSMDLEVTKIGPIALDVQDRERIATMLNKYGSRASFGWGTHPFALPLQFGYITILGSSKKEGAQAVARSIKIPFDKILGVGDSKSDWQFMQLCGYVGVMSNGTSDLKELAKTKGKDKYYVGGHVDENGLLKILSHFSL